METGISADVGVVRICGQRDEAIRLATQAAELIREGRALAAQALETARAASAGRTFHPRDRTQEEAYRALFTPFDPESTIRSFRRATDAAIWMHLLTSTGMESLMDATARDAFFGDLAGDVPEINEANVDATFESLIGDAKLIFARGLARAFSGLDRRFRSHDAFKVGARIILTSVFNESGGWNYYGKARAEIADVERVLAVLDGEAPNPGELIKKIEDSRTGWSRQRSETETRYLKIRGFKNGNAHLWFTRPDLVKKANLVLADYYGAVLPDAVGKGEPVFKRGGLPSKNLAFYATPPKVVAAMLDDVSIGPETKALEPSAGTGNIARALLARGAKVTAVEVDGGRVEELRMISGPIVVRHENFLMMPALPIFDLVVMNPPFVGTHWIEHVVHAFDFLLPGGVLKCVLPISAEFGDTRAHEDFRGWAQARAIGWKNLFRDLPSESFASSGTRISTTILTIGKPR